MAELQAEGAPAEVIAAWQAAPVPEAPAIGLWPRLLPIVDLFCRRLARAWQHLAIPTPGGALVVRTGLDWPAVEVIARAARIKLTARRLDQLQAMETAALSVWAEQQRRALRR